MSLEVVIEYVRDMVGRGRGICDIREIIYEKIDLIGVKCNRVYYRKNVRERFTYLDRNLFVLEEKIKKWWPDGSELNENAVNELKQIKRIMRGCKGIIEELELLLEKLGR